MVSAEKTATGVSCSVKGNTHDTIIEAVAVLAMIVDHAIQFDEEDGKRMAQASIFEITERIKAYSKNKYGFDVLDADIITKAIAMLQMKEWDSGTTSEKGESE